MKSRQGEGASLDHVCHTHSAKKAIVTTPSLKGPCREPVHPGSSPLRSLHSFQGP